MSHARGKRRGGAVADVHARAAAWQSGRRGTVQPMEGGGLLTIAYVVIGAFVAAANSYYSHLDSIERVASAVIAILLWPLILLGVDIRIT